MSDEIEATATHFAHALIEENRRLTDELSLMQTRIADLERLADTDTLTPLPNRRAFLRDVERAVQRLARHGTPAAVMFIDVDQLKRFNDSWGHQAGDEALLHVARTLTAEVRASDIVARIGGDEFGLLLDPIEEAGARAKSQSLLAAIAAQPLTVGESEVFVTLSVGLAMIERGDTAELVLARADAGMYRCRASREAQRSLR